AASRRRCFLSRSGFMAGPGHVHEPPGFIEGGAIQPIGARLSQPIRPTVERIITAGNTVVVRWHGHAVAKDGLGTTTATTGSCEWSTGLSRRPSPSLIQRRSPTFSSPSAHRQSHDAYRE